MPEIITTVFLIISLFSGYDPIVITTMGPTSYKAAKAHNYHGILSSIEDETGSYFYRDGRRCSLYSRAFMKKWKFYQKGEGD